MRVCEQAILQTALSSLMRGVWITLQQCRIICQVPGNINKIENFRVGILLQSLFMSADRADGNRLHRSLLYALLHRWQQGLLRCPRLSYLNVSD